MQKILVDLKIDREEWLRLYRGETRTVFARTRDGRSVQFPANILNPYVLHGGIEGSFLIQFDDAGKFQSIAKV